MQKEIRPVEDHEEFVTFVQRSKTGIYVQELWRVHSNRRNKPVSSGNIVRKAFTALYEREGWDRALLLITPGVSYSAPPKDAAAGRVRRRSNATDFSEQGFWRATMPVGYWEHFDAPESHIFDVRGQGSDPLDASLWAFEYTSRLAPEKVPPLPEFEYRWEAAIVDNVLYIYDESPEAPYAYE